MTAITNEATNAPDAAGALEAAVRGFAVDGLHGASMDGIAAAARLTKPALYRRFGSKDQLFERAVASECARLTEHLLSAYAMALELPLEERLGASFDAFFRYAEDRPLGFRLLFRTSHHVSSTVAGKVDAVRQTVTDRVATMVRVELTERGHAAPKAAEILATMLVGMCEYTARRTIDEPTWDRQAIVRLMAKFAAGGGLGVDPMTLREVEGKTVTPARRARPATREKKGQ